MTREEFEEKYKNAKLPEDLQEQINKAANRANLILSEYETEYQKIQLSYSSFFHNNGIIKPYDINEFFSWIANKYPDENLPFIVEVAKNPNSYKMFHDYNLNLFYGNDNFKTKLNTMSINEIFDFIRNEDVAESDIYKLLKNYTEDFDSAIVKSVLKDLDFYLFVEKEEMEAQFSYEEVDSAIALRKEKGLEIPYYKRIEPNELTGKQKQNRKQAEEKGFVFGNPIINKEPLLFPFEFMNLYRLKNLLNSKLKEDNEKSNESISNSGNDDATENIDVETNIDIDLLKYLSENFTSNDKRFKDLTKYNHIYFYLFPIENENNRDDKRALHQSYKILIKKEFGFDYGNSQISVNDTKTYKLQLINIQKNYLIAKRKS